MKKFNLSYLFYLAGILWLFTGMIGEDMSWGYALGFWLFVLFIVWCWMDADLNGLNDDQTYI